MLKKSNNKSVCKEANANKNLFSQGKTTYDQPLSDEILRKRESLDWLKYNFI